MQQLEGLGKVAIMLVKSKNKVKLDHWKRKQSSRRSPPLLRQLKFLISRQEEAVSTHSRAAIAASTKPPQVFA